MKIIEAMKKVKALEEKASDLKMKIGTHCAALNTETPVYENQFGVVTGWLQAHHDIVKEIERLKLAISKTNLMTDVTITIGEIHVTKSITAWILRRSSLAGMEQNVYRMLTDRGLKEGIIDGTQGQKIEVKIVRYYNPVTRDSKIDEYRSEPHLIDSTLEVINAVTDLIE